MAEILPIYEVETEILHRLPAGGRLILSAPTGSGKSTQVPQMLLRHGVLDHGQAVILQPRRLAARMLAGRVAREMQIPLGREVGYQIRFENCSGPETRIKYVTEGILLRQMMHDPKLSRVSALIFDEFHERHLYGDITLARALDLQEQARPDLRIIVMSATLEASRLEEYLKPCSVLSAPGRAYPVQIEYAGRSSYLEDRPVWEQAVEAFREYVRSGGRGDTLIFMPGGYEIGQTIEALRGCREARDYRLFPLHGELSARDQDAAVASCGRPKVVVATNVAETSLTIPGIRLVIDSGLARIPRYDPYRGINTLLIEKTSRASAEQRAGRAGRTAPGLCLRLWSEREHQDRPAQELPEVKRLDLAEVVLTLKAAGIQDLSAFRWLEPPEPKSLADAVALLADLGALDKEKAITSLGRQMLSFPLHPRYARLLLAAQDYGCVYQAALLAALTQGRDLLLRNVDRPTTDFRQDQFGPAAASDFWVLLRAWEYAVQNDFRPEACRRAGIHAPTARQVGPLLEHFLHIAQGEGLDVRKGEFREEPLQKCLLACFSDRVARRVDSTSLRCELAHGRRGLLARESVVQQSPLLVAAEVREVGSQDRSVNILLSLATAVRSEWLMELFPEDMARQPHVYYDPATRRVYAEEQLQFRQIALESRRIEPPPASAATLLLANEVLAGRLPLSQWDESVDQWIIRLNLLSRCCPELELPPIGDEDRRHLVEQLCHGAFSHKDIKDRPVKPVIKSWLNPHQQQLVDKYTPERLELPNGRRPKVVYESNGQAHISLRIQELYGITQTPRIAMGRIVLRVQILAPSMRPVQITQDLASFWRDHYPKIKQELQRKYPKHEWR